MPADRNRWNNIDRVESQGAHAPITLGGVPILHKTFAT